VQRDVARPHLLRP